MRTDGIRRRRPPIPKAVRPIARPTGSTHSGSRVDRARNPRGGQVRLRHGTRRALRRAGGRVVRRVGRRPCGRPWLTVASFVNPTTSPSRASGGSSCCNSVRQTTPSRRARTSVKSTRSLDARVPGGIQGDLAEDDLRDGNGSRLPAALLLPAQARRSGDRADPRVPGTLRHGDDTIVVFTSDHGDSWVRTVDSSRSGATHSTRATRVPLLIADLASSRRRTGSRCTPATSTSSRRCSGSPA